jgi:hypothetical protein
VLYNPLQPPEPGALASRLAALAMESISGASSPPLIDDSPTSDTESNTVSAQGIETTSAPASSSVSNEPKNITDQSCVVDPVTDEQDGKQEILREHIKSLYRLWKLGRLDRPIDQDKELFLHTVKEALEQL